jgi:hypothetical protein
MAGKQTVSPEMNVVDELHPRISLSIGLTIPMPGDRYKVARAEAGLTIDKPYGFTTEQTYKMLEHLLSDKVADVIERTMEMLTE